jgi:hypothetical protein
VGKGGRRAGLGRATLTFLVVGVVLTNLAMVSVWSWRTFASSQGFADVTTDMLKEPAVREVVAEQIVGALGEQKPTSRVAIAARPVVESIVAELVSTRQFQGVFHAAVRELHSSVVNGLRSRRLKVDVDETAPVVRNALKKVDPKLAAAIPEGALPVAVGVSQSTPLDTAMRVASLAGWLAIPFVIGACGCFAMAVRRARHKRRAVEAIGISLVLTGVAHFALLSVGVNLAASFGDDPRERTALRAVFWSLTHLINVQAKVVITVGAVVAVAAAHAGPGRIKRRLLVASERTRRALARPGWRTLACVALIASGVFAMRWPEASAAIVVRVVAFVAFVAGAVGLLDVLGSVNWADDGVVRRHPTAHRFAVGATGTIACVSVAMLFGGLAFAHALRAPKVAHADMAEVGCNGDVRLCGQRLDQVVFAGTHNSMAAFSERGWLVPRHRGGIDAQLQDGVRAFLLDLHYGAQGPSVVRTGFPSQAKRESAWAELSPVEQAVLEPILAMFGDERADATSTVYLCHLYCELGATPALEAFQHLHDFLRLNPNEVVVLVLEDYVSPEAGIKVLERSGLADQALEWHPGDDLPTLGQMIREHKNVVVLVEHLEEEESSAPWYIPAYQHLLQDTPFTFDGPEDFSCDLGRGEAGNEMFLMNHWLKVDPPDPDVAAVANAYDVLLERARRCKATRGWPNIIAVDFYDEGDLFEVVDELNGVGTTVPTYTAGAARVPTRT